MSFIVTDPDNALFVYSVRDTQTGLRVTRMHLKDAAEIAAFAEFEPKVVAPPTYTTIALVTDDIGPGDVDPAVLAADDSAADVEEQGGMATLVDGEPEPESIEVDVSDMSKMP